MDFGSIETRISDLDARMSAWSKPIDQAWQANFARVNRDGYTAKDLERDMKQIRETQLAKGDIHSEIYVFYDQLMPQYLAATGVEREQTRSLFRKKRGMQNALLGFAYRAADGINSASDSQLLRLGLAAMSIEDFSVDYRDSLLALAELCVRAERAGIDPRPIFDQVAEMSSDLVSSGGATESTSHILREFQNYAVLNERRQMKDRKNTL
jgi:hypothetical protein